MRRNRSYCLIDGARRCVSGPETCRAHGWRCRGASTSASSTPGCAASPAGGSPRPRSTTSPARPAVPGRPSTGSFPGGKASLIQTVGAARGRPAAGRASSTRSIAATTSRRCSSRPSAPPAAFIRENEALQTGHAPRARAAAAVSWPSTGSARCSTATSTFLAPIFARHLDAAQRRRGRRVGGPPRPLLHASRPARRST